MSVPHRVARVFATRERDDRWDAVIRILLHPWPEDLRVEPEGAILVMRRVDVSARKERSHDEHCIDVTAGDTPREGGERATMLNNELVDELDPGGEPIPPLRPRVGAERN